MKKETISFSYSEEKVAALRLYLEQKGQNFETELTSAIDNLYAKVVPSNVRNFIDLRLGIQKTPEKKKQNTPVSAESLQRESEKT